MRYLLKKILFVIFFALQTMFVQAQLIRIAAAFRLLIAGLALLLTVSVARAQERTTFTLVLPPTAKSIPIPNVRTPNNSGGRVNGGFITDIRGYGKANRYVSNPVNNSAGRWQIRINNAGAWIDLAEGPGIRKVLSNDHIRFFPTAGGLGRAVSVTFYAAKSDNPLAQTYPDFAAARAAEANFSDPQTLTVTVREPTIYRVTMNGAGMRDGSSWANAAQLQAALGSAGAGDQIWIAAGTYRPHVTDRAATFSISAGVEVYGGFAGTESVLVDVRAGAATILSGDLLGDDIARPAAGADATAYNASRDDNSNMVVAIVGADVTLDGLTITAGGAGLSVLLNIHTTMITACLFTNNNGSGGAYFGGDATLTGCTFTGNTAGTAGGGAWFNGTATLTGCTFTGNTAGIGGGAYFPRTGTLTGCVFAGNTAVRSGGGAYIDGTATLTNCIFTGNTATSSGGLVLRSGGTVINSTFFKNWATNTGGGIWVGFSALAPFTLQNSILVGNTVADAASGHQVYVANGDAANVVTLQNNLLAGGAAGIGYLNPGTGSITEENTTDQSDALVVFASTDALNANYLHLKAGSPAVNAGNNAYLNNGTPANTDDDIKTDVAGNVRIQDGTVDLGAYEYESDPLSHTGDITVTTQAAVDALRTSLAGKTIIDGNVTIGGSSDITDLTPLSNIVRITGNLTIPQNERLDNLNGLTHLQSIGGYFAVVENSALTDLGDFPVLQSIGGYFAVVENSALTDLGDFPVLQTIGGLFHAEGNIELTDLGDFPVLQSIGGYFYVSGTQLTDLGDFPVLQSIGGYFAVGDNSELFSLGSFPTLTSIGIGVLDDSISIAVAENPKLILCSWLEEFLPTGAHAVTGGIYIQDNAMGCETTEEIDNRLPVLVVENRLFTHKDSTTTSFNIYANVRWQLATSDDATWITSVSSGSSTHSSRITGEDEATITLIHTRAPSETPRSTTLTLTAIDEEGNELTNPATMTIHFTQLSTFYKGDITLSSQEEVKEFISNTTFIDGNLTIGYTDGSSRSDITDLTPLSNVTHITGNLIIQQNEQLNNINDLTHLQTIGGYFYVYRNDSLTNLGDFPALQTIGGYFYVYRNDSLTNLGDFPVLQTIGGYFEVLGNSELTDLGDFPVLQTIGGYFNVIGNGELTDLGDFPVFQTIGGDFNVIGNGELTDLGDFPKLQTIGGYFNVSDNAKLDTLGDFPALQTIEKNFNVSDNAKLDTLGDFSALQTIGINFQIFRNNELTTLGDFPKLQTIGGNFNVSDNAKIDTLGDFPALQTIGRIFQILRNNELTTSGDFPALQTIGRNFQILRNNELTTSGDFPALQTIGGGFLVSNNGQLTTLGNFSVLTSIGVGTVTVPSLGEITENVSIVVENNSSLSNCSVLTDFLPGGAHTVSGGIYVNNNATRCSSQSNILSRVYQEDITVSTQEEVNILLFSLKNIDTIDGNLTIGYTDFGSSESDITDLSPLGNIVRITGNVRIRQNGQLVNLTALTHLQSIGGSFQVNVNSELTDLGDFLVLQSIGGSFHLNSNHKLTTLGYFPALQTVGGDFSVVYNFQLTTLGNFPTLQTIGGGFEVSSSPELTELGNFSALQSIGRIFNVINNDTLTTLGNFSALTSIGVESVTVPSLRWQTIENVSIVVEANPNLSDCFVLIDFLPGEAHAVSGKIYINDNAGVCTNQNALANTIYRGDITVTTQAAVDALRTSLAGKTIIVGNVTIGYTDDTSLSNITDLVPLGNVVRITENLIIQQNGQLVNLTDLTHLQTIGGYFIVRNNNTLTTLGIFSALQTVGGAFGVISNTQLTSFGNFPTLQTIRKFFSVRSNDILTTLGNFSALTSIGVGSTTVPSLGELTGNISIVVEDNSNLSDCYTLTDFLPGGSHAVSGEIYINNNASVCSNQNTFINTIYRGNITVTTQAAVNALLDTLSDKTIIDGNVTIGYTDGSSLSDITDLSPLSNIVLITGNLIIQQNGQLKNLNALTNLQSIGESFYIYDNDELNTLGNFPMLTSIGIGDNIYIPSLSETRGNVSMVVENNPSLSDCHVLIDFLLGGTHAVRGQIFINNNASVCSNQNTFINTIYNGNIRARVQPEIDALSNTLFGKTIINGNLTIGLYSETNITNLTPLRNITHITENLSVGQTGQLINLNELNNLQTIGGDFEIRLNDQLTTLGDFPALQSIGGYFGVIELSNLSTLGDFPALQSIGTHFAVGINDRLTTLGDFPVLQTIGGDFGVIELPNLSTLGDFPALQSIGGIFGVSDNDTLTTLGNFPALQTIGGFFGVEGNAQLTDLGDFPNLTSIGMDDNVNIPSLGERRDTVSIVVEANPRLSDCCVLASFLNQENNRIEGHTFITNNAAGCEDKNTIQNTCHTLIVTTKKVHQIARDNIDPLPIGFIVGGVATGWTSEIIYTPTQSNFITLSPEANTNQTGDITITATPMENMGFERTATINLRTTGTGTPTNQTIVVRQAGYPPYEGDVVLTTQADVNAIRTTLDDPRISVIEGNLTIGPSDNITNLDSLYFLSKVTGNINVMNNFGLVNAGNFPFLQKVEGNFSMLENGKLEHVGSFPILVDIGGYFSIKNNDNLRYLYDFPALTSIDSVEGVSIEIKGNDLLTYCCILTNFMDGTHQVSGSIDISDNATGCDEISEVSCAPFIDISDKRDTLLPFISSDFDFTVSSNRRWRLSPIADWVTLSVDSGGIDDVLTYTSVTITPLINTTAERRTATIKLTTIGHGGTPDSVLMNIIQEAAPEIRLANSYTDRDTVDIAYDATDSTTINFTVGGSATGWEISITYIPENTNFITLDPLLRNDEKGDITTMAIPSPNTNHEKRTAVITLSTRGHEGTPASDTLTIIQEAAPMIMLTSHEPDANINIAHNATVSIPIEFTLDGSATGWESDIIYMPENTGFIDLSEQEEKEDTSVIKIIPSPNTTTVSRTAKITLITTGQLGTPDSVSLMITQEASPNIDLASHTDGEIIAIAYDNNNDTDPIIIKFTLGGSATGWESDIIYMPENTGFIDLSEQEKEEDTRVIKIIPSINDTTVSRTAMITLKTMGQRGDPASVIFTITQEAAPTIMLTSPPEGNTISIAHDDNIVSIPIEFTVGGSATGWESEISYIPENTNFITLDTTMNGNQTGPITIMASPMKNAGVERTATITLRTTGQKGDPVSVSLKITQEISPTIELTSYNEGSDDSFLELKSDGRDTIAIAYDATDSITINFTVGGSATDWESYVVYMPENDTSIMISQNEGTDGNITITPSINTSAAPRTATITLKTAGHEGTPDSVLLTVTQEAIPTIELISNDSHTIIHDATDSITINFTIGGSATGWESDITDNPFISLSLNKGTGQTGEKITIMVIPMKNTGVIDRTDTITLSTMGQTGTPARDTFTITQKAAPAIMLTDYTDGENVNIAHDDTNPRTISFALGGSATGWKSDITDNPFISLSSKSGTNGNITITPSANDTTKERTATITLITTGPGQTPDSVSLMITQEAIPAIMLSTYNNGNSSLNPDGDNIDIAYDHTNSIIINFVLGGSAKGKGWKSSITYPIGTSEEDKFIDSSLKKDGTDPNIIIPIKDMNTTPVSRTATITLSTTGQLGISDSVLLTIIQEGTPVLELTSGDNISRNPKDTASIPIKFTVGGSATGWESEITYAPAKDTFITLSPKDSIDQTGPITIMASPMENTDIKERTATITLRTTGQKGRSASVSLTITQTALPNTPMIELISIDSISIDSISIAHDDTIPKDINFTVGGSAGGWESKITYMPDIPKNTNFITLNPPQNDAKGSITIEATSSANEDTIPRTATITLSTTGHDGDSVSVSLIITQEAKPVLKLTSNDNDTIAHDAIDSIPIHFNVGGSARGWESEITYTPSDADFVTLSSEESMDQTGTITIMASPSANTDLKKRTATIILSTKGNGASVKDTLTITQAAAPEIKLTSHTNGENIKIAHNDTELIPLNFTLKGSAEGWTDTIIYTPENADFITIPSTVNHSPDGTITFIQIIPSANTTTEPRTATIILKTRGHEGTPDSVSLIITQEAMPVIELISKETDTIIHDDTDSIPINFILGGSATGWMSNIIYTPRDADFVTLSPKDSITQTGDITIMASPTENTDNEERMATITLSTTGQIGDSASAVFTIIQKAKPTIILRDNNNSSIQKDHTIPIVIRFTVGGSANGWTSHIDYMPDSANFITLNLQKNDNATGNITIRATPSANTSIERTATIILITSGHEGTPDSVSLTITQAAGAEPSLGVAPSKSFTLYPNPTTGTLTIEGVTGYLQMYIYDLVGREVMTYSLTPSKKTIDVSDLPSGMYVVTLRGENKTWKEVLMKK